MNVRVYRNLTKNCWSVQHKLPGKGWRLLKHCDLISLKNVTTKVYESGRQRVIKEGKKYVHAYIEGEMWEYHLRRGFRVVYNPYSSGSFHYKGCAIREPGLTFNGADRVTLDINGAVLSSS